MKVEECVLCHDFGYRQVYETARVERIFCDCLAGQRRKEKIEEDFKKLKFNRKSHSKNGEIKDEH